MSYIHREILTGLYLIGVLWPVSYGLDFLRANAVLSSLWAVTCLAMSVFTLLPANKVEDLDLMCVTRFVSAPPLTNSSSALWVGF